MKIHQFLTNFLEQYFWSLMACYGVYLIYCVNSYFTGLNQMVNKEFYDNLYLGKLKTVGLIIGVSIIFKVLGKTQIASLVLSVPAVYKIVTFLLVILVWLFLAAAMIIFGKS